VPTKTDQAARLPKNVKISDQRKAVRFGDGFERTHPRMPAARSTKGLVFRVLKGKQKEPVRIDGCGFLSGPVPQFIGASLT
jgi:hypothetical protein